MGNEAGGVKSAARTAGAVLLAGAVLAALLWGNRDFAMLGAAAVLGAALLGFGLSGGAAAAAQPVPTPSSDASGPPAFGSAAAAGSSDQYARADHAHGLPELPAPGGDLGGALAEVRVTGLQGTPVANKKPVVGNVLIFNGTAWGPGAPVQSQAAAPPPAPGAASAPAATGRSVGRGAKGFDITAAGEFEVGTNASGQFVVTDRATYGALTSQSAGKGDRPNQLIVRFKAGELGVKALASDRFVAALTAVDDVGLLRDYRLSLRGPIKPDSDGALNIAVLLETTALGGESSFRLRFQILVTRYDA